MSRSYTNVFFYLHLFAFFVILQFEDDEKLKKRKERFGIMTAAAGADVEVSRETLQTLKSLICPCTNVQISCFTINKICMIY